MKFAILLLLTIIASSADAQKLKDMLYKGKLKKDTTAVIRKTDDLSTRMVDTTKKIADVVVIDSSVTQLDSVAVADVKKVDASQMADTLTVAIADTTAVAVEPAPVAAAPVKSNNRIWKEYTDSLYNSLKAEVLNDRKIKKETYYVTVDYEISAEGEVSILNVTSSPENEILQNQIKDRIISAPPVLAVSVDSTNKARKVKRKYNFTVTKE